MKSLSGGLILLLILGAWTSASGAAASGGGGSGHGLTGTYSPTGSSGGGRPARVHSPRVSESNLRIEVSVRHGTLSDKASFVVANASQANYVRGGDKSFEVKTKKGGGIEFKKYGLIVNVLPVVHPDDPSKVTAQLQIEISGPVKAELAQDISTWQMQTEVVLKKGRKTVIADDAARVEVTVSDFEPD